MQLPAFLRAIVVSQDPDNYGLNVSVQGYLGGQMPTLPVQVGTLGPRDAVRGNFPDLPQPGTHGLVAFPHGDPRNGIWLCAFQPALNDASAHAPGMLGTAYAAHYGGGWSWHGQDGTRFEAWPDGSTLLVGSGVPSPTRHVVAGDGTRQRHPFGASDRVRTAPGAFQAVFSHPSGARASLTPQGAWTVLAAAGQTATLQVSGGASVTLAANGSILVVPAAGQPVTVSGALHVTGPVLANFGASGQVGLSTHSHTGVQAGTSNSGPPVLPS